MRYPKTMYAARPRPKRGRILLLLLALFLLLGLVLFFLERAGLTNLLARSGLEQPLIQAGILPARPQIGDEIDSFNGVAVYYNGPVGNVSGRSRGADGYNIGQKYQCVEFVKRYYYEALQHKMPSPWGHAKDFFNPALPDGALNPDRGLVQYRNGGHGKPQSGDLIVFGSAGYGHVAIVAAVLESEIEIVQQNPGPYAPSRERHQLLQTKNGGHATWTVVGGRKTLGWLRKE